MIIPVEYRRRARLDAQGNLFLDPSYLEQERAKFAAAVVRA